MDDCIDKVKEAALRILDYQDRTASELRGKLLKKNFDPEAVEQVIASFTDSGILDDGRYAELYARSKLGAGKGRRWIEQKLKQKGVSGEITEDVFRELSVEADESVLCLKRALAICGIDRLFDVNEAGEIVKAGAGLDASINGDCGSLSGAEGETDANPCGIDYFSRKVPEGESDRNIIYRLRENAKASLARRLISAGYAPSAAFDAVKKIDRL